MAQPAVKKGVATQGKKEKTKPTLVKKSNPYKPPKKLGKFGRWLLRKFGKADDAPSCAQETIPYKEMFRDGICKVTDKLYNKTVVFADINYQLAQNDEQDQIFNDYRDFLNHFDSTVRVQLTFTNKYGNIQDFERSIYIPEQNDIFNAIRREYSDMLKSQIAKGNNGLVKFKYVTFGIESKNFTEAKSRLERIEIDVINGFRMMGVFAQSLTGTERLEVLHGQMHPDGKEKLIFNMKDIIRLGISTHDAIAPTSFDFRDPTMFKMGNTYGAVSFLQILSPDLPDRMLNEFLTMDTAITVNMHVKSIDQQTAIKAIKRKILDLDATKIDKQRQASREGIDPNIISVSLQKASDDMKEFLDELQERNERMFMVTYVIMNTSPSKQTLEGMLYTATAIAQKYNCALKRLDYQQEQGIITSLPLGLNQIEIERSLTTSATAINIPFTTSELFQGGQSLYYGLNALSNNLIMADRRLLRNPNGLVLGTPSSGKSFWAKREITNTFLITQDDIIITDPEGEYHALTKRLGGQVIKLSASSKQYINPMDINLDIEDEDDDEDPIVVALRMKSDFILSLCELVLASKDGLQPRERSIIDRCVTHVYKGYIDNPCPENVPIIEDLYNILLTQEEEEAKSLATALELVRPDRALCEVA